MDDQWIECAGGRLKSTKKVFGVGINDTDYNVMKSGYKINQITGEREYKIIRRCPFYNTWRGMISRCYSNKKKKSSPSYTDCTVSDEWLTFSNFKSWMETQEWEGKHLDKDLAFYGNKHYSEDNCNFVNPLTNTFIIEKSNSLYSLPIGVTYHKKDRRFQATCRNPFTKTNEYLGQFKSVEEAHRAWLSKKLELSYLVAEEETNISVRRLLVQRYKNYPEVDFQLLLEDFIEEKQ